MNRDDSMERWRARMMAALDGELDDDESNLLEQRLADDAELREEWDRLRRVKEVTVTMSYRQPPEEIWEGYWLSVYNRFERGVGWILLSLSTLVLTGWGLWRWLDSMLRDSDLPGAIKIAIFALVLGLVVLLFSVIREKLFTGRRDAYKEIQR